MATRLRFDFYGDVQLDRTLERMEAVDDMRPAWEAIADHFAHLERRQFASQGGFSGGWSPLSPRYAAWKARNYPGKTILRRTDDLWRSLTERPFGIEVIEKHVMVIGSDVDYGAHHQRGDGVPRRRPIELTEAHRRTWVKIIQRYIVTGDAPTIGPRGGIRTGGGGYLGAQ
jgi:phage gpG-like protein